MTYNVRLFLVSTLLNSDNQDRHKHWSEQPYGQVEYRNFRDALREHMPGIEFCQLGANSAIVYRPGDTHSMGEIGYKDVAVRGTSMRYFVSAPSINNEKFRPNNWLYKTQTTTLVNRAVSTAATHLRPVEPKRAVAESRSVASGIIGGKMGELRKEMSGRFSEFSGLMLYNSVVNSELFNELETHRFISPQLQARAEAYYDARRRFAEVERLSSAATYYVGLTDSYGQVLADMLQVNITKSYDVPVEVHTKVPMESLPSWVLGKMSVLQMLAPTTYVEGVGLRLDDRVFYVMEGE